MTLTLTGRVPTKKNHKRVFRNKYTGKITVTSSAAYEAWHEEAGKQLLPFRPSEPMSGSISIAIHFKLKGRIDADVDNMMASVVDLLQDMGFLENDKQIVEAHLYKLSGYPDFSTVITLEPSAILV